jgi:hypothetical protein
MFVIRERLDAHPVEYKRKLHSVSLCVHAGVPCTIAHCAVPVGSQQSAYLLACFLLVTETESETRK